MKEFTYNGETYNIPDEMSDTDAVETIVGGSSTKGGGGDTATSTTTQTAPQTPEAPKPPPPVPENLKGTEPIDHKQMGAKATIDPATLVDDPEWMEASRIAYRHAKGVEFNGNKQELRDWGLNAMAFFNYNSAELTMDAATLGYASPEVKKAYATLIDKFDKTEMSWAGTGRWLVANATDPANWFGLETLGVSLAAKEGAKAATKAIIKQALITGVSGAVQTGAQSALTQEVKQQVGLQKEFSLPQLAVDTGIGLTVGTAFGAAGAKIAQKWGSIAEKFSEPPPKAGAPVGGAKGAKVEEPITLPVEHKFDSGHTVEVNPNQPRDQKYLKLTDITQSEREALIAGKREAKKAGQDFDPKVELDKLRETQAKNSVASAEPNLGRAADAELNNPKAKNPTNPPTPTTYSSDFLAKVSEAAKSLSLDKAVTSLSKAELDSISSEPSHILANLNLNDARAIGQHILSATTDENERTVLAHSVRAHLESVWGDGTIINDKLIKARAAGNTQSIDTLTKALAAKTQEAQAVREVDLILSSNTGRTLGTRAGDVNTGAFRAVDDRGNLEISPEGILWSANIDPKHADFGQKEWANRMFWEKIGERKIHLQNTQEIANIDIKIKDIFDDWKGTNRNNDDLAALLARREEIGNIIATDGLGPKEASMFVKASRLALRYIIANVFSLGTVVRNTLPSAFDTLIEPVIQGMGKQDAQYTYSVYKSMFTSSVTAWKMGVNAFKYEKSFITGTNVYSDGIQGKGYADMVFTAIPRFLNATDEFFAQIQYHGYATANAQAKIRAIAANMPENKREAYIQKEYAKIRDGLFKSAENPVEIANIIRERGIAKGLRGPELDNWLKQEIKNKMPMFKVPAHEDVAKFIERAQFKTEFGEHGFEGLLGSTEKWINTDFHGVPIFRLFGQLFFRTPVRVAEVAVRMTPGLQLVSGKFVNDLKGLNGEMAKNTAIGHMMKGYALTGLAMTAYGMGNLTGRGPSDPEQNKAWRAAGHEEYTLKWGDTHVSFKNYDPISTSFKLVANILDGYSELDFEERRGSYTKDKMEKATDAIFLAVSSLASAISDTNMLQGVVDIETAIKELFAGKDSKHQVLTNLAGKKAVTLLPWESNISKTIAAIHPELGQADPRTISQAVLAKAWPWDPTIPHRHDALGNKLQDSDPVGTLLGFHVSSTGSRQGGRSPAEMEVLQRLHEIGQRTGAEFAMPFKTSALPHVDDLRQAVSTVNGKNLYDEANALLRSDNIMFGQLHELLVKHKGLPEGTKDTDGYVTERAKEIIKAGQDRAFLKLRQTEAGIEQADKEKAADQFLSRTGVLDVQLPNYSHQ